MKIKTTMEILAWSKKIELTEKQQSEVFAYIGALEQIINSKNKSLNDMRHVLEKDERTYGNTYG